METAANAGFDGVVCGGPDIAIARAHNLRTMVPGIRLPVATRTIRRVSTRRAMRSLAVPTGSSSGRAVAAADDPERAAEETTRDVAAALARASG